MNQSNFNKKNIAKNFSQAAKNYDESALVQKLAAKKLCELAAPLIKNEFKIIDIGSGTSAICKNLTSSNGFIKKNCQLFEIDLSLQMLKTWPDKSSKHINSIVGDGENLPLKNESLDIIISSFSLQWLQNFEKVFNDFYRILKKDGILAFCLPNSSSLEEIKIASVKSGCNFYFSDLPKTTDLKSQLEQCGFKEQFIDSEIIESQFEGAVKALKSLKKIGANYSNQKNFITKKQLQHFDCFNSENQSKDNKKFAISWNISYFVFHKSYTKAKTLI